MTLKEYREKVNPCFRRPCYDPDFGCTIPGDEHYYACPLVSDPDLPSLEDFENSEYEEDD